MAIIKKLTALAMTCLLALNVLPAQAQQYIDHAIDYVEVTIEEEWIDGRWVEVSRSETPIYGEHEATAYDDQFGDQHADSTNRTYSPNITPVQTTATFEAPTLSYNITDYQGQAASLMTAAPYGDQQYSGAIQAQAVQTYYGNSYNAYADISHNRRYADQFHGNIAENYLPQAGKVEFGPFRVIDVQTIEMNGIVDRTTLSYFAALRKAHPDIRMMIMRECPGSHDDAANLQLARMVNQAGIAIHVPANGSIRSGAVELFLAGVRRTAHPDAEFAVHSWRDESGLEAYMLPESHPIHQEYLSYYREMGIDGNIARAFYNMTNSVPFNDALWLKTKDIARFGLIDAYQG